jgi:glucose 1-dehydrogenase
MFLCAREAAREFLRRGVVPDRSIAAGKIICMSSVHGVIPWAGHCNYAASKGGIMLRMKSLAQELAPHSVRVNSIGPGAIKTPINRMAWETPEAEAELLKLIPYNRVGAPADIRAGGRVAGIGRIGFRDRNYTVRRWWYDALSWLCYRRMSRH